uniref:Uncharacterized protein n=1 Tax=Heterorhabditis bacteriophora TaxID=37862 RepID=A0A1I7XFW4_HETBA
MIVKNPPAKEDTWAFQPIGAPFPPDPVKCIGEQNMYVALWYKHGKPIHGRAWNNGGVVECSFPYNKSELKTKEQLEGQIQVLQYTGDHTKQGFWYEWIQYKDRFTNSESRQMVKCGDSFPILWNNRKEGALLGYVNNKTENALFSCDGKVYEKKGGELAEMYVIMRNTVGGPPFCECANCPKVSTPVISPTTGIPPPRIMLNEWLDIRVGDPWPTRAIVKALDKTLDTIVGENPDQYVALWYMAGEPVMGRASPKLILAKIILKVAANFGWFNNEYKGNAASFDKDKEWHPVHVNHHKGDISAAVITINGKQILGKCDIRNEKSSAGFGGKENILTGPNCANNTIVLCRRAKTGYKFD